MTTFDWASLPAAQGTRREALPEMINHVLLVLAELMEETDYACEFDLTSGPLIDGNVAESVQGLLEGHSHVERLEPAPGWRLQVRDALPQQFLPSWQSDAWMEGAPARTLAEALTDWAVALMGLLWPEEVDCWKLTVGIGDWYAPVYVDIVVSHLEQVWLLHLSVSD